MRSEFDYGPTPMTPSDRREIARQSYEAYITGDRQLLEGLLTDEFMFWSPADPGIDRATYFERCWPNSENIAGFEFKRLEQFGDEVLVTYEAERTDSSRFRNTEVLGFTGDQIRSAEVYFGWNL
jgi:ketosteroid isomerase-like protein